MSEVRGQRSEVRDRRYAAEVQRSEVGSRVRFPARGRRYAAVGRRSGQRIESEVTGQPRQKGQGREVSGQVRG